MHGRMEAQWKSRSAISRKCQKGNTHEMDLRKITRGIPSGLAGVTPVRGILTELPGPCAGGGLNKS